MDRLGVDQQLTTGGTLTAANGTVTLVMQSDGNAVLYRARDGRALWASATNGRPVVRFVMQGDGNLVAYGSDGHAWWASGTDGHPGSTAVLQDDGNLVVYDSGGTPRWASNTVQVRRTGRVAGFRPSTHAPLFANGPWPAGTQLSISILGFPSVNIDVTKMGLCGGMSFLTRDIVESGTPQLRGTSASSIPISVAQHILNRLIQSFGGAGVVPRWLSMTSALDHDTVFRGSGDFHQSVNECGAIMADIDAGRLCPIGLVLTESFAPWDVFKNHVVLVWGYDVDGEQLTLHTYDCNKPGRDDIVITLDIDSPTPAKPITTNGTDGDVAGRVRGFFRLPYQHADPSPAYVDDASVSIAAALPTPIAAGATAVVAVDATNTGSTTWTQGGGYRLGSQSPQDNTTWGTNRLELPFGPVDPGRTVRFGYAATAPGAGRYGFAWQMVRESVHWFGHPTGTVTVEVGATAGETCTALAAQRAGLEQQLADVRAEIAGLDWADPFTTRREAAALNRQAQALARQIRQVEAQQLAAGCAPV